MHINTKIHIPNVEVSFKLYAAYVAKNGNDKFNSGILITINSNGQKIKLLILISKYCSIPI